MPAILKPISVYGGDTLSIEYRFRDSDDDPVNLSAWTFTSQWRVSANSTDAIAFTVDSTNLATGVVKLTMTGSQTDAMGGGGVFDLQGVNGSVSQTFVACTTLYTLGVTRA